MSLKNKTTQRFITLFILISVLVPTILLSKPQKTEAFWFATIATDINTAITATNTAAGAATEVVSTGVLIKNVLKEVLKQIGMSMARKALQQITKSTINWINTGSFGNPLFLENPKSFFTDIVKFEVKNIVDTYGYDLKRFPFGKNFALNTIYTYKSQLEENAEYSLSKVIKDPILVKKYRDDFSVGGWNGFLMHTQYPQNNPIGFNMVATEQLARRLEGTAENAAQGIKKKLDQGMGFLSPQTCPSNPSFKPDLGNQFQRPSFKFTGSADLMAMEPSMSDYPELTLEQIEAGEVNPEFQRDHDAWQAEYNRTKGVAQGKWNDENGCPGGFVDTTPGSAIANAAMEALGAPQKNAYVAMATGSLSAIFDALLSKLLGEGLNALATTVNPGPAEDNWDYMGNTLGTVTAYNRTSWDSWTDEVIILSEFKKDVAEGIKNTTKELEYIYNESPTNPGIIQMMSVIWPKIRNLDMCIPGPNLNWEERMDKEMERTSHKLMEKSADNDGEKAAAAQVAFNELKLAVSYFKDWIKNQQMSSLPSAILYQDAVEELKEIHQQYTQIATKKQRLTQALARLQSIQTVLDTITKDPEQGSEEETILIELKKQYNANRTNVSNPISIDDTRNDLSVARDTYSRIDGLLDKCKGERITKGWSVPGGYNATLKSSSSGSSYFGGILNSELALFCSIPIKGGYTHSTFNGPDITRPRLPMVNAKNVYQYNPGLFLRIVVPIFNVIKRKVDIEIQCPYVFRASDIEYKGSLPGAIGDLEDIAWEEFEDSGGDQCADTGNKYTSDLRKAMDAVLAANPNVASLPNIEDSNGYKANGYRFMQLVEAELNSNGFNATADVLNGNNNPSKGDIIAIWKDSDEFMERYDTLLGDASTIGSAAITDFKGFIPKECTATGGSNDCGCRTNTDGTDTPPGGDDEETPPGSTPPVPNPNPTSGNPFVTTISPATATPGVTTITITGTNLTSTVQFFDGSGGRTTVVGSVNSTKTQVTVLTPASLPIGKATVKIYKDANTVSNGTLITISASGPVVPPTGTVAPSVNATTGWLGNAAHNSTNNTWMIISGDGADNGNSKVSGRIMSNNSTPITSEFKINPNSIYQSLGTKVAYSPNINKYLAVWVTFDLPNTKAPGQIYGRFVNPDGTFSGNVFSIFKDSSGSGATAFHANSLLQYDSKNKKFVLVWMYDGVKLITISESGIPGTPIQIVSGITAGYLPSVAVSEKNDEYCVAYDKRSTVPRKVAMKKINAGTMAVGAETTLSAPGEYLSIANNSTNNQYLVSWGEAVTTKGRIVKSCNINDVSGSTFTIQSKGATAVLSYNPKSNNFASIVQNQTDSGNTYNILSATGAKIKEGLVFTGGFGNFAPTIVANKTDGTFAATSALEYGTTRFAPNLGTAVTSTTLPPTTPGAVLDGKDSMSMAFNPTANNWIVTSATATGQLQSRLVSSTGVPLTTKNIIDTGGAGGGKIIYAPNLNKYLVIWGETPTDTSTTTYGRFLSPTNVNDGAIFEIDRGFFEWGSFNNSDRLQYDSINKKFVFSYMDNNQGILLFTIDTNKVVNKTVVAPTTISNEKTYLGQVAVNEDKNEYCVNMFTATPAGVRTQILRSVSAGTKSLGTINKATRGDGGWITYNTVNKEYLTVYNENGSAYGQALGNTCSFANAKTPFKIQPFARTVTYNSKSNSYAVIAEGSSKSDPNPTTIFNHTGTILKRATPFSNIDFGIGLFNPMIEANTNDGTFAAITNRSYADVIFTGNLGTATGGNSTGTVANPKKIDLGSGSFPDPIFFNGRIYVAYRSGDYSKIYLYSFDKNLGDQQTEKIFNMSTGAGGFPRLTVSGGTLWVAYRDGEASGQDIKLWRKDTGVTESLGPAVGNDPVALGNGYVAWQTTVSGVMKVKRRLLTGGTITTVRDGLPTGISRILTDGSVIMIDTDRNAVAWGLNAWFASPLTIAVDITPYDDNGVVGRFNNASSTEFNIWLNQRTQTPHAATDGAGNYVIATWNPTVRIAAFKYP